MVLSAGFEPALPKETDLESVALDHSAKTAYGFHFQVWTNDIKPPTGIEPVANCLEDSHSTTELWRHSHFIIVKFLYMLLYIVI